eukprot:294624_1
MADESAVQEPLTAKRNVEKQQDLGKPTEPEPEPKPAADDSKEEVKEDKGGNDDSVEANDKIKVGTHFIAFKWRGVKEKKDCDTKHMLYLLHLALEKTRIRQIERNKNFASLGRKDRIMVHPDYPGVITKFIDWHNQDTSKNKFDGELIEQRGKKDVTNNVLAKIGDVKWGWATKFYHYLTKEVNIDADNWHEVKIPNYGHTKLASDGKTLDECTVDDIVKVMESYAFIELTKNKDKKWPLEEHKEKIISYVREAKIDGPELKKVGKKQFVENLKNKLDPNNKKLKGPCTKLYACVEKCNLNDVFKD